MYARTTVGLLLAAVVFVVGCSQPKGESLADQRDSIQKMKMDVLADLEKHKPGMTKRINEAPGYAVFSSASVMVIFVGGGDGYGVAHDKATGKETYMRMAQLQGGIGVGLKDFRGVFVFNDKKTFDNFVDKGWQFGGEADASARSSDKGGSATAAGAIGKIDIYRVTKAGVNIQATIAGTKYWKDDKLNMD